MIILNTVNHENNKIEYHFTHDNYNGAVYKILASFDIMEDGDEHYLTCEYEQLQHNLNGFEVEEEIIKQVCDEFSMAILQSLYGAVKDNVNLELGSENASK